MKEKPWLQYFIYISLILIVEFSERYFLVALKKNYKLYFISLFVMIIIYIGLGLILGIEHLKNEKEKEGSWKINFPKLIIMGVPCFYFSLGIFIYYNNCLTALSFPIGILMGGSTNFMSIFQLILGYTIITSFYKTSTSI